MSGSAPERAAVDPLLLSRIEDASLNASAPTQQRWVDGWLVRFSPGKAKRARCVNAVASGRGDLESRLLTCERIFSEASLPLIVRITPFSLPPGLDTVLEARGMARLDDTRVMLLQNLTAWSSTDRQRHGVSIRAIGLDAFAHRVGSFRGSPLSHRQAHAERLLGSPVSIHAFELLADGRPAACGQFAQEGDLVGLYDIFTTEPHRGRGLASQLCQHLLSDATARGARHAYLQVEADNHPARAVYHRLGFADGYRYHYRTTDASRV